MANPLFGAGFRTPHFEAIAREPRALDWFEVVSENFIALGGPRRAMLERLRAAHPIALHGVSLSIAGSDPLDDAYLWGLRALAEQVEPMFVSDHLCWTTLGGHQSHDLLPVALTPQVLEHVVARLAHVQEALGRRILLENASGYVAFRSDELDEAELFRELCRRSGCGMLLDVNNLYVNAQNLGIDPQRYLATLARESVGYMHLAGHAVLPDVRIDTHGAEVPSPVWALFDDAARRFPAAHVIIERDENLPEFEELRAEVELARARHARAVESTQPLPVVEAPRVVRSQTADSPEWSTLQSEFWKRSIERASEGGEALVAGDRPVSAARGLRVYADAYASNLPRALEVNFSALARVLDASDFAALAASYLRAHPPRGHDFRGLGARLAEFVRGFGFARDYGIDPSVFADLVALEQAQLEVQDELDEAESLAPESLAALAPEQWDSARFVFVRALRVVRASHDVLPVVEAVAKSETPARPKASPTSYRVFRSDGRLRSERISEREADLAERLLAGASFGEACEAAHARSTADLPELAVEAARLLAGSCRSGLVLRVS
ncbi:MAG: DUF692 family multinuclear iron-containing protein [Myxococcota bacterium]